VTHAERVAGGVVGLAIGDALGYPHEFRTVTQVQKEIGPDGITDFVALKDKRFSRPIILGPDHPPGTYTDDTQMSLAVAEALIARGHDGTDALMDDMSARFVTWYFSEDNNRSPGAATGSACEKLKAGGHWRESGTENSKGAGANMRVVPVGLFFAHLDDVERVARMQAIITHVHPASTAAAAGTAIAAAMFLRGASVDAVRAELEVRIRGEDSALDRVLGRLPRALARPAREVLVDIEKGGPLALGESWVAEEALAGALYCVAKEPTSFERAVLLAVNTDGDSDTIATLVGGFMGARLGLQGIPERWRRGVENSAMLHELGARLAAASGEHC
jgi:ADP-ribosylglycohydrolase